MAPHTTMTMEPSIRQLMGIISRVLPCNTISIAYITPDLVCDTAHLLGKARTVIGIRNQR